MAIMLTPEDYREIERRYHDPRINAFEQRRCHALLLLTDGYPPEQVAELLSVPIERVAEWQENYRVAGIAGIEAWF
jgi:hypothetical protein